MKFRKNLQFGEFGRDRNAAQPAELLEENKLIPVAGIPA
jgi:hypothetical protein